MMSFFTMGGVLVTYLTENHGVFENDTVAEAAFQELVAKNSQVQPWINIITQDITGVAAAKQQKRVLLEELTWFVASRIRSYATVADKPDLLKSINFSKNNLSTCSGKTLIGHSNSMYVVADANKVALEPYGITTAVLSNLSAKIEAYSLAINTPASAWDTKREAYPALKKLYKEMRILIKNRLDMDMMVFQPTNPDFYNGYLNARVIYDEPTHTMELRATVVDSETSQPISEVQVSIPDAGVERTTGTSGVFQVINLLEGPHDIHLHHPKYQPLIYTVTIVDNETTKVTIPMIRN